MYFNPSESGKLGWCAEAEAREDKPNARCSWSLSLLLNCRLSRSKEDFVEDDVVELEWHTRGNFLTGVGWYEA